MVSVKAGFRRIFVWKNEHLEFQEYSINQQEISPILTIQTFKTPRRPIFASFYITYAEETFQEMTRTEKIKPPAKKWLFEELHWCSLYIRFNFLHVG